MDWPFLLAYMWQIPYWLIILCLLLSVLVCSIGMMTLVLSHGKGWKRIAGTICFFLGLTWLYAVVAPPFHAPDEPTHFLGMLHSIGRNSDMAEVADWANRGHFLEIQFSKNTTFKREWSTYYTQQDLSHYFSPIDMESRAPLTALIWKKLTPVLGKINIQWCLLTMRILNGVFVTGFYALALVVLWKLSPREPAGEEAPISAAAFGSAVLLYVPALPFFAMHVSNYPMLISAGILAASIALSILLFGKRPLWLGGLLGASVFFLLFSGRGGLPFSAIVLFLTIMGAVLPRSRENREEIHWKQERISAAVFWAVFALGWIMMWPLFGKPDCTSVVSLASGSIPFLKSPEVKSNWILAAVPVVSFAVETLFSYMRYIRLTSRKVRLVTLPGVFLFSLGLLGPTWGTSHYLQNIEGAPLVPASSYIMRVLIAFWGSQGLGSPDYFLIKCYWTGFGWLETLLPGGVVMLLALPVFCGNLFIWWQTYRAASLPLVSRMWAWFVACALYLAVLALFARSVPVNLHGRYLILFNLLFLPLGFAGFFSLATHCSSLLRMKKWRFTETVPTWLTQPRAVWNGMIILCASIHCYSIWFLLNRYF